MIKKTIRVTGADKNMVIRCKSYPTCKWIGKVRDVIDTGVKCPKCGGTLTNDPVPLH